jgi:hypothetical protein
MVRDDLRKSGLARALSDLLADLADLADLLRKELRLAKTEIAEKITSHLRASMWMVVVGVVGIVTALLLVETAVVAVASFGIALHWSCMLASAVLAAGAAAAFDHGRSIAEGELLPTRTVRQISREPDTYSQAERREDEIVANTIMDSRSRASAIPIFCVSAHRRAFEQL